MKALESPRKKMSTITSELRIRRALASKVPRKADLIVKTNDLVRVYRETDRRYIGPFPVVEVENKQIFVLQGNRRVQYSLHQIIPQTEYKELVNGENLASILHSALSPFFSS